MISLIVAAIAGYGTLLIVTATLYGWRGLRPGPRPAPTVRAAPRRVRSWLAEAGLADVRVRDFVAMMAVVGLAVATLTYALFGALVPALTAGAFAACVPIASSRRRRALRIAAAQEAWPRMIEEIRVLTGSLGRGIPQALFEVGARGPVPLRPAFESAKREWLLSTDFGRTVTVLKGQLVDPTADAALETLVVAQQLGGTSLDRRLEALAEDRRVDVQGRKDARAKQAGVRFARRFVVIVPVGMAFVGLQIGDGRAAYATAGGQLATMAAIASIIVCWIWSARLLRVPAERRVFPR
jgi:tight adherence protein B